jgi:hypothetical protein
MSFFKNLNFKQKKFQNFPNFCQENENLCNKILVKTIKYCITTVISLEPRAEFEHFILRFNQMSLLRGYH